MAEIDAIKPDRRTARSRAALTGAFIDLLLERGIANVTAGEVAARADVARSTLYAHFGGLNGLLAATLERPSAPLAAIVGSDARPEDVELLLAHFRDQRRRNRSFFEAPLRSHWVRRLAELIEPRLAVRQGAPLPAPFVARQVAEAQLAFVANWLGLRPSVSEGAAAAVLVDLTRALVAALAV